MIRIRIAAAALAALAVAAPAARAQSVLSARGLGYPLEALDARSRGLGGITTGLGDPHLSLVNPAAMVGVPAAGLSVTFQGDEIASQSPGREQDFGTARFPAVMAVFPVGGGRLVTSVGYAGVLDQTWSVRRIDSLELAGQRRQVVDDFLSEGGAARLRIGAGYRLLPRVDVGLGLDVFTGALRDSAVRSIEGLIQSRQGANYTWGGVGFSAGARWRGSALSVSAAVTGGGELTAEPADSGIAERAYSLPLTLDAGASGRITQRTLAALSVRWAQWSSADEMLAESAAGDGAGYGGGARDALQLSGGLEYEGVRFLGRPVPLRVGGRYTELPFRWSADVEFPDERAVTGGLGMLFSGGAAALELGGERGWRGGSAAGLDESFWRLSFSLSLLGR